MIDTLTYLSSLFIFTKKDVVTYVGNERNAVALLYNYSKKGLIANIRRNLYCVCNVASRLPEANKMQIASAITPTACVSYHSAMEYYGFAHQFFYEMQVASNSKFNSFEFDGIKYRYHKQDATIGVIIPSADSRIRVTDVERTIIDCVNHIDLCGGVEEIMRCIRMISYADENKMKMYLQHFSNKTLYKKTGYVLENFGEQLHLSSSFFQFCIENSKGIVAYLSEKENCFFEKKWNLYVPEHVKTFNEIELDDII